MDSKLAFGMALKELRTKKRLTQEDFSDVSSRTYLSTLERGLKSPTIEKIEDLSTVLNTHPLTLLFSYYLIKNPDISAEELLNIIRDEISI